MANLEQNPLIRRTGELEPLKATKKSERVERLHIFEEEGTAKKTDWKGHLPAVMLSAEAQRDKEHHEKEEHLSSLMQQLHPEQRRDPVSKSVDDPYRSNHERLWADRRMRAFERRLHETKMTENEMDRFGEELIQIKHTLEDLQTKLREEATFNTIERLEALIHASKLTQRDALHELAYGGVKKTELEEETAGRHAEERAEIYAERIKARYGATPEELDAKKGHFFGRVKLTWDRIGSQLLRWTARLSGMETDTRRQERAEIEGSDLNRTSKDLLRAKKGLTKTESQGMRRLRTDFDLWREAQLEIQSGELARNERLPQIRKQRPSIEERRNNAAYHETILQARATLEEQKRLKDRAVATDVLGDRARVLFDEIKDRMAFLHGETDGRFSFTAEEYVVNAANYVDALDHNQKGGIKEYGAVLREMNKDLGWPADIDPRFPRVVKSFDEASPLDVKLIEKTKIEIPRSSRRRIPENPKLKPMTVASAQTVLPDAHGFWELVKDAYLRAPKDVQDRLAQIGTHDSITNYVLLTAQVLDATKNNLQTPAVAEALTMLNLFAKDLGIPEHQTLIPPAYATPEKKD